MRSLAIWAAPPMRSSAEALPSSCSRPAATTWASTERDCASRARAPSRSPARSRRRISAFSRRMLSLVRIR